MASAQQQDFHAVIELTVDAQNIRLDQYLAQHFPEVSRARLQQAIKDGDILLNARAVKPKEHVFPGDRISGHVGISVETEAQPEAIPLDIVHADADIIVINKPAGLVVHPAVGNPRGTVLNALLHHFPETRQLPRAGIVHRLDKDTSGLMVVARSLRAHTSLVQQLQSREMHRTYLALVHRYVTAGNTIDLPMARHHKDRTRMAVRPDGKEAITHYRIEERFGELTLLRVQLETGRTHQIRVHMAEIHHPLVGDPVYGNKTLVPKGMDDHLRERIITFPRQALHATELELEHPGSGEYLAFSAPLPDDMAALLEELRQANLN
ncbi:MAG: 23S rRNA pseudouridine(1911/1915/1917) synthase RluD [Cardiobacteriaceae bacterium]|nr:23S rRNA pseudouridine(1911/1915/1917) synthase RluD [Cardiobacteriaceae bacterium]